MMNDVGSKQIVIWETSAISNLAMLRDCDDLIAQMNIAHNHWIPSYIFDEIAAFHPDLLILDLLMPNIDGFQVLDQIRMSIPQEAGLSG